MISVNRVPDSSPGSRDDWGVKTAQIAAIVEDRRSSTAVKRLVRLLNFLGIPWNIFKDVGHLRQAVAGGLLQGMRYAVISSLPAARRLIIDQQGEAALDDNGTGPHSAFFYITDETECSELLKRLTGSASLKLVPVQKTTLEVRVSKDSPAFTGPMHGLRVMALPGVSDCALAADHPTPISRLLDSELGPTFFGFQSNGMQVFCNGSAVIPDLDEPLPTRWYDVKRDFLSAVPLVLYLKWAFQEVCWQPNESGACLIVDDPILRSRYGFCNFPELDVQMRKHSFTTNISLIPWNWQRTSSEMARLIKDSHGRFSVSIHGCDHTKGEFGTKALLVLQKKTALAKQRMELHHERTRISHDLIMVFPQGVFSRESLKVLQQYQFIAAVNTETKPTDGKEETLTLGDVWNVAIVKYEGFPIFARRSPNHGLENFAFDLLLGKPCLIVEHHEFFRGDGRAAAQFIDRLNSINCKLRWRSLGEVVRRCYLSRSDSAGVTNLRMFGNELLVQNESDHTREYRVEKHDQSSVPVKDILVNGTTVKWQLSDSFMNFAIKIPAHSEVLIQILYDSSMGRATEEYGLTTVLETSLRRHLADFRDTFLFRRERLIELARKAARLVRPDKLPPAA